MLLRMGTPRMVDVSVMAVNVIVSISRCRNPQRRAAHRYSCALNGIEIQKCIVLPRRTSSSSNVAYLDASNVGKRNIMSFLCVFRAFQCWICRPQSHFQPFLQLSTWLLDAENTKSGLGHTVYLQSWLLGKSMSFVSTTPYHAICLRAVY